MTSLLYIDLTNVSWIRPELFPSVPVLNLLKWYGLMYVVAFVTAFIVLRKELKEGALNEDGYIASEDDIFSFIWWGIVGLVLGARIFSCLVYDTTVDYWHRPWLIFWPFDPDTKQFTGFAGMSYHGGFIGGLIGMLLWCKTHKRNTLRWIDAMAVAIPLGYTFGRFGNFMNGELYGRITTMPWGMIFPRAAGESVSASLDWVQAFMQQCGMTLAEGQRLVNLPRHPSQLYEALFEGVGLWCVLWLLRKHKPFDGFLACCYTIGYGLVRFVIEYFREPDADLGYRISANGSQILYTNTSLLNISTGQILCFIMITVGLTTMIILWRLNAKKKSEQK
ncbi:MAG TPA: prolipoprotein diacylglyceryl transferase [Treponema sp.]|nr:prolipoprotein diacylglyceryl transferase [Treponema sp.]